MQRGARLVRAPRRTPNARPSKVGQSSFPFLGYYTPPRDLNIPRFRLFVSLSAVPLPTTSPPARPGFWKQVSSSRILLGIAGTGSFINCSYLPLSPTPSLRADEVKTTHVLPLPARVWGISLARWGYNNQPRKEVIGV